MLRRYAQVRYGAKSWGCERRVSARIEAGTVPPAPTPNRVRCSATSLNPNSVNRMGWRDDRSGPTRGSNPRAAAGPSQKNPDATLEIMMGDGKTCEFKVNLPAVEAHPTATVETPHPLYPLGIIDNLVPSGRRWPMAALQSLVAKASRAIQFSPGTRYNPSGQIQSHA